MTNADDLDFTGRTVLVTGGGTSIGRAVVLEFAARGAQVIISDADEAGARAVERDALALEARLSEAAVFVVAGSVDALCAHTEAFERVDIVVSAAPPTQRTTFFEADDGGVPSDPAQVALWRLARAFVPGMMEGGWGRIVSLGRSDAASALTRTLAADLGEYGITVNEVDTGSSSTTRSAIGRVARPDEVAFAVVCLCSPRSGAITGSVLRVDGGARAAR